MADQTADADASTPGGPSRANCCAVTHSLSTGTIDADVETFATLGNGTRYEALRLIAEADRKVCVCELEPSLPVSQGAVSQALSRLYDAGLVDREKRSRWRYYGATPRAKRLLAVLDGTRVDPEEESDDG
jgi:ArsR family transcriptional regulator